MRAIAVHSQFQGGEYLGRSLGLVEYDALWKVSYEAYRILSRTSQQVIVVEADVLVVPISRAQGSERKTIQGRGLVTPVQVGGSAGELGERGLAGLPGAVNQDYGGVLQGFGQATLYMSWVDGGLRHRLIVEFICVQL